MCNAIDIFPISICNSQIMYPEDLEMNEVYKG